MTAPGTKSRTPVTIDATVNGGQPVPVSRSSRLVRWLKRDTKSPVSDASHEPQVGRRQLPVHLLTFFFGAVLPCLAFFGYFAFVATDQYVAVSKFAVRGAAFEQPVDLPSAGSSARSSSMPMVVGQDAYIIVSYIKSFKVIEDIAARVDVRAAYQHPAADFWERLSDHANKEDLLDYWNKRVSASVDGPSGIVTVRVRAFTPNDAVRILNSIIWASESLANDISARARRDMVSRAEEEVNRAMGVAQAALTDLQRFRERAGLIDPISSATMTNTLLLQLLGEKIKLENELYVLQRVSPDNGPGQRVIRTNIDSVQQQIDRLKDSLTGQSAEGRSIANALVEYERLEMQRVISQKLLGLAQEALQRAVQRAARQNIYVTTFVAPFIPQESEYPQRWQMLIMYCVLALVAWGILTLLVATVDDHRV